MKHVQKKGMIDKPADLVMVFMIVALIITAFGAVYVDLEAQGTSANDSTAIFTNMTEYAGGSSFVKGASDDMTTSMSLEGTDNTESGFISSMGSALLKLGKIWSSITHAIGNFADELRIPIELVTIISTALIITTGLAIYLWWRGVSR